jgi:hypothetical protein
MQRSNVGIKAASQNGASVEMSAVVSDCNTRHTIKS